MSLEVYKEAGYQSILICNETSSGITGVMTCPTGNYTGMFFAKVYRTAFPTELIATLHKTLRDMVDSSFGLFAAFILSLAIGLIGVSSPVAAIALLILGLIPILLLGTINTGIFMGIAALGGIVVHYLRKV